MKSAKRHSTARGPTLPSGAVVRRAPLTSSAAWLLAASPTPVCRPIAKSTRTPAAAAATLDPSNHGNKKAIDTASASTPRPKSRARQAPAKKNGRITESSTAVKKKSKKDTTSASPIKRASVARSNTTRAIRNGGAPMATNSLVHDAIRRAYHRVGDTSEKPPDYAAECERLREELERVMGDHQRQADEIVALRALAKSLKQEVECMQDSLVEQQQPTTTTSAAATWHHPMAMEQRRAVSGHEFFQLDAQIDALQVENQQLRTQIHTTECAKRELQVVIESEMPRFELLAVQAQAELASTMSQLSDEQAENDRLRSEVAYYKARSRSPVRAERMGRRGSQEALVREEDGEGEERDKENQGCGRANASAVGHRSVPSPWTASGTNPGDSNRLRESLLSSVTSLSMSAASAFSSQLQDDVDTLKNELRRLHRSIDASVENARRSGHGDASRRRRRSSIGERPAPLHAVEEEHKTTG